MISESDVISLDVNRVDYLPSTSQQPGASDDGSVIQEPARKRLKRSEKKAIKRQAWLENRKVKRKSERQRKKRWLNDINYRFCD